MNNEKFLLQYLRDKRGKRIGCIVALNKGILGWSKCSRSDNFNRHAGVELAKLRARITDQIILYHSIVRNMVFFKMSRKPKKNLRKV